MSGLPADCGCPAIFGSCTDEECPRELRHQSCTKPLDYEAMASAFSAWIRSRPAGYAGDEPVNSGNRWFDAFAAGVQWRGDLPHQVGLKDERVVLSGEMLKAALEFVAPDGTADQMEAEVMIGFTEARTSEDGDAMPAGYYCWLAEYPEEGCVPLFETVAGKKS